MAKRIVDEEMRFSVIINGDEAQKELSGLEKETRELTSETKDLRVEKKKLQKLGKKETAEYKAVTAAIKENNSAVDKNKSRMKVLQNQIGITGLTFGQLTGKASQLRLELRNMVPGTADYKRLQKELGAVNARLKQLRMQARSARSSMSRLSAGFNKYAALGASVIATTTGMILSIQRLTDINGELSDAQANVQKTTGATREEVEELTKSFGAMKTRTARIELLGLAEEAGRLGISGVQNLKRFVAVANEIKIALGDDLSDEAIREVGKMTNIFKVADQTGRDYAESMQSLGSSINEVAASGANTADYLVDFMRRTAGISGVVDVTADKIVGLAAGMAEVGVSQEIAGTAITKTFLSMLNNVEKFANVAGVGVDKFRKLVQEDASEALLVFAEGLTEAGVSSEELVKRLNGIDIGGARGAQALLALSTATDTVRKRQETANKALFENTSLTDEAALKNNNLAATLAKIKNRFANFFTSTTIAKPLEAIITGFAKFIGATEDASGKITAFRRFLVFLLKAITAVIVGVISYNAAIKITTFLTSRATQATTLHNLAQKASLVTTRALRAAKILLSAAYFLLTGNITRATAAMRLFSITTKLTPWGLLAAAVAAVGTAYFLYSKNVTGAAKAARDLAEVRKEVAKTIGVEKSQLQALLKIAKDEELSKEKRFKAIKKINEISPKYLENINLENINTKATTKSVNEYIKALEKKATAQAIQSKQEEALRKKIEANLDAEDVYQTMKDGIPESIERQKVAFERDQKVLGNIGEFDENKQRSLLKDRAKKVYDAALDENTKEYKAYTNKLKKAIGEENLTDILAGMDSDDPSSNSSSSSPSTSATSPGTNAKESSLKGEAEALARLKAENARLEASLISDNFKKELELEKANHAEKIRQLEQQMIEEAELKGMSPEARQIALQKNKELNNQIEFQDKIHENNKGGILQKGLEDRISKDQEQYERKKRQREIKHNNELAALGNDEEARKALQEKFNKEELERETKHLEDLLADMKEILGSDKFGDVKLDLLSEEEKQRLLDALDEIGIKFSQIKGDGGGEGTEDKEETSYGDVDVLGFSVDQWNQAEENLDSVVGKIEFAQMAVQGLMNAWGMYHDFQAKKQQVELQEFERNQRQKEERLRRQLDTGRLNQRQYNRAVEEMEKETQRKRAEMEYKTAKREKEMMMAQIVLNTAAGVAKALAQGGLVLGVPWAAIVGAMGAIQLGIAAATPLPAKGFEKGLYPVQREQDGKMFNAGYGGETRSGLVNKPTMFLAGEARRPEMIIDDKAWKKFDPALQDTIHNEIARVKGFETGLYKQNQQVSGSDVQPQDNTPLLAVVSRAVDVLDRLEKNGVIAYMERNMENSRKMSEDIKEYQKWRNSNKR